MLGSYKPSSIDSSDNTNSAPSNRGDMGPVLGPCKLHSIVRKDNVNPVSVELGNSDIVDPVLGPCILLHINRDAVNLDFVFQIPLVEEDLTGEVCWDSEPFVYFLPSQM